MQAKVDQKTTLQNITQTLPISFEFFKAFMNLVMKTIHQFQAMLFYWILIPPRNNYLEHVSTNSV
jgi:hypothetical protein